MDFSERSFGTPCNRYGTIESVDSSVVWSAEPMTQTEFAEIINSSATHLYVAEENHTILGMLSLAIFPIPTGVRAWVEDVVVKTEAGKGVGKLLTLHAISESKKFGAVSLDLTSRPSREIANKLYQSVGFDVRETNVYRYIHKE